MSSKDRNENSSSRPPLSSSLETLIQRLAQNSLPRQQQRDDSTNNAVLSLRSERHISARPREAARGQERKELIQECLGFADSLDTLRKWMKEISEDMQNDVKKNTMSIRTAKRLMEIYELYYKHESTEQRKLLGDQICSSNGGHIFTQYLRTLTENGKDTPTSGYKYECLKVLRNVCWNYSDSNLEFGVQLGSSGAFYPVVADLQTFEKFVNDEHIRKNIILHCFGILHNCGKAVENKRYFKEANVVKAILPYAKAEDPLLKMIATLTLAYAIEEKDSDTICTDGTMIKFILRCLKNAIQSPDHKYDITTVSFSALEIVDGLIHLASNDNNKNIIVNEGILPMLLELMEKGNESEKALSAKAVWALAFSGENSIKIGQQVLMMKLLKELQGSKGPASWNASGALWTLTVNERTRQYRREAHKPLGAGREFSPGRFNRNAGGTSSNPKRILISCQVDSQNAMIRVKEGLEKLNYKVYLDAGSMNQSTLQTMAEAVENSDIVLICISRKYKESQYCRTQAEYAYKLGKNIIPLHVEAMYEPDGWLGALQGSKKAFDFTKSREFGNAFFKLAKELGDKGNPTRKDVADGPRGAAAAIPIRSSRFVGASSSTNSPRVSDEHQSNRRTPPGNNLNGKSILSAHNMGRMTSDVFFKYDSGNIMEPKK